jgi:hypothetical protein
VCAGHASCLAHVKSGVLMMRVPRFRVGHAPPRHARPASDRTRNLLLFLKFLKLIIADALVLMVLPAGCRGGDDPLVIDRTYEHEPAPSRSGAAAPTTMIEKGRRPTTVASTITTRPAPGPSVRRVGDLAPLTWPPPVLRNPVTYRVSGTPKVLTAPAGQDSVVRFVRSVHKRLILQGGRNWVIIGGDININEPWPDLEDRNAILVKDATGVVHIEGVLMHGSYINDGIKTCSPEAILQIQSSRIVDLLGTGAGYHADVIQPYCGFRELRVDGLTGYSQFQGQMFKADWGKWRTTHLRRVNLVGIAKQDGYPINVVTGCCNHDGNRFVTGPISLSEIYVKPDASHNAGTLSGNITPSADFTYKTDPVIGREYADHRSGVDPPIKGRIWKGLPPSGDYVPEWAAGMGYVASTYLSEP